MQLLMANGLVGHGRGLGGAAVVMAGAIDRKQKKQAGGAVDPGVGDHGSSERKAHAVTGDFEAFCNALLGMTSVAQDANAAIGGSGQPVEQSNDYKQWQDQLPDHQECGGEHGGSVGKNCGEVGGISFAHAHACGVLNPSFKLATGFDHCDLGAADVVDGVGLHGVRCGRKSEILPPMHESYPAPQTGDNALVTILHTIAFVPMDRLTGTLAIGLLPCRPGTGVVQPHSHRGTSSSTVNHAWPHASQPRLRVTRSSSKPLVAVALILSLLHRGHFMGKMGTLRANKMEFGQWLKIEIPAEKLFKIEADCRRLEGHPDAGKLAGQLLRQVYHQQEMLQAAVHEICRLEMKLM